MPLHGQELSNSAAGSPVVFNVVPTPDIGAVGSLSASSENNVWATSVLNSTSLHFDGSRWDQVRMAASSRVNRVLALSPTNAWAVGQNTNETLSQIQHFNGSSWSVIASPHFAGGEHLNSLKAVSASSIFAVGSSFDKRKNRKPLVEHFDGTSWSVVSVPSIPDGELFDISGISSTDIWAIGTVFAVGHPAITIHFDGQQWTRVPAPAAGLVSVAAISAKNVWAVGTLESGGAVIEHWNGRAWKIVPSVPTALGSFPSGISAISPTDIWAVGCDQCGDFSNGRPALVEHWDGTNWTIVTTPSETFGVAANAVLSFPSKRVFIGGFVFNPVGPTSVIFQGME